MQRFWHWSSRVVLACEVVLAVVKGLVVIVDAIDELLVALVDGIVGSVADGFVVGEVDGEVVIASVLVTSVVIVLVVVTSLVVEVVSVLVTSVVIVVGVVVELGVVVAISVVLGEVVVVEVLVGVLVVVVIVVGRVEGSAVVVTEWVVVDDSVVLASDVGSDVVVPTDDELVTDVIGVVTVLEEVDELELVVVSDSVVTVVLSGLVASELEVIVEVTSVTLMGAEVVVVVEVLVKLLVIIVVVVDEVEGSAVVDTTECVVVEAA